MPLETLSIFIFVAALIVLTTAGWVLFLFFWVRGLPRSTRSLAAALLGSAGLLVPLLALGNGGSAALEDVSVTLVAVILAAALVGLPTALLANRKLEHVGTESAGVFD